MDRYVFNPFTLLALLVFGAVVLLVLPLVFLGIIGGAFVRLGFSWREVILILFAILLGSFVNIPITTLEGRQAAYREVYVPFVQAIYRIPVPGARTVIALNVGGGLIPTVISLYLLGQSVVMTGSFLTAGLALLGVGLVTVVAHLTSRPVPGLGIVSPVFVAPLSALLCGLLLSLPLGGGAMAAPVIAYTSGTLGVRSRGAPSPLDAPGSLRDPGPSSVPIS